MMNRIALALLLGGTVCLGSPAIAETKIKGGEVKKGMDAVKNINNPQKTPSQKGSIIEQKVPPKKEPR